MPYINKNSTTAYLVPFNAGELNYKLSREIALYLSRTAPEGYRYSNLNEVIGVLECCKQELIRRLVDPYEEKKRNATDSLDPYRGMKNEN